MLNKIKIDLKTYTAILDTFKKHVQKLDISKFLTKGYGNKEVIALDIEHSSIICKGSYINYVLKEEKCKDWMQYVCDLDLSMDASQIKTSPYGKTAYKKLISVLKKKYSLDEIDKIFKEHALEEHKPIKHQLLPEEYHDGHVYKFIDCVYYDINGAHRDALIEMFPKAEKAILKLDKVYINYAVGEFCNEEHRDTFNWIVTRTREYLDEIIKVADGEIIYANTDGVIIHHPTNYLATSEEIGAFKSEIIGDTIYAYFCKGDDKTTQYTIYQYIDKNGKTVLKGNSKLIVREGMDLSKGIVNKAKIYKDKENNVMRMKYFRTEEIEIYEEV